MFLRAFKKIIFLCLGLLLLGLSACGGTASPPSGIPAPVSELMSIVPDPLNPGQTYVVGQPGAVWGGASVLVKNLSQDFVKLNSPRSPKAGSLAWLKNNIRALLISPAQAQTAATDGEPQEIIGPRAETAAAANGSFVLLLLAKEGDVLAISQSIEGETSEEIYFDVPPQGQRVGAPL